MESRGKIPKGDVSEVRVGVESVVSEEGTEEGGVVREENPKNGRKVHKRTKLTFSISRANQWLAVSFHLSPRLPIGVLILLCNHRHLTKIIHAVADTTNAVRKVLIITIHRIRNEST